VAEEVIVMKKDHEALNNRINLPYRRGVGMMILGKNNLVFVGKRFDSKGDTWQMPQGGIDGDETVIEAGLRELSEETNIKNVQILAESKNWFYYDVPDFLVGKLWDGQYRGQKQKWLLLQFLGDESEINISTENPEFAEWKWVDIEMLPELIVSFKKTLYNSIVKEFSPYIKAKNG
jgi:putative (di)nucleoside polyphosphate hydrolase